MLGPLSPRYEYRGEPHRTEHTAHRLQFHQIITNPLQHAHFAKLLKACHYFLAGRYSAKLCCVHCSAVQLSAAFEALPAHYAGLPLIVRAA